MKDLRLKEMRAIGLMASENRLWASLRIRDILHWQEKWADNALHGHMPGRRAEDVCVGISMTVESALADGSDLAGMSIDWSKCCDRVPQKKMLSCSVRDKVYTFACCNRCAACTASCEEG